MDAAKASACQIRRAPKISILDRLKAWWAPAAAFALTLVLELALVERKYAVFGGGFGASQVIDRPGEAALFLVALLLVQALLIAGLFLLIRALHGRKAERRLFLLNFLFFTLAIGAALLTVKYQVLSYFSDAIGFKLIRNLGGGSVAEALLYVRDEVSLVLLIVAGAALFYWLCLRLAKRLAPADPPMPPLKWKHLLWLALAFPLVALAANRSPDARFALSRFNAYALADSGLAALTDFDRDGYSWFGAKVDDFPFDPTRHPLALDIPGNGVDEDGFGGDFVFSGEARRTFTPKLPAQPKHLVLIMLESVRGDAIGRRVGGREVTPVLNALARKGTYVEQAYSHVGFTSPSLKSLFSAKLDPVATDPSLFRDLKANGYRVGVYSAQAESFGDIAEVVGTKAAADEFVDAETLPDERTFGFASKSSIKLDGRTLLREFDEAFSESADWRRPVFLYFNFQEAHFPYHHPRMMRLLDGEPIPRSEINAGNRDWVARTYWNAVAFNDWLIGQVIARLKKQGVWDDTLLVVAADHGESLFDDDFLGHGHVINRQQTHVPLVISEPNVPIEPPIGLDDYRATILRLLGAADVPAPTPGPVFQYIGDLHSPTEIGMVERGGRWTTMRLGTELLWFSDTGRRVRYDQLPAGSPEWARADRLVDEWARQRWLAHLDRR